MSVRQFDDELFLAHDRIAGLIGTSRLTSARWLSETCGGDALFKREDEQVSGSFKYRGALNKALAASSRGVRRLCTASTGNHGLALAWACRTVGLQCTVLLPTTAPAQVVAAFDALDARLEIHPNEVDVLEQMARQRQDASAGVEYCSPYNDIEVVAGCSTLGVELASQLGSSCDFDVVCAVGGGGLSAGLGLGLLLIGSPAKVYAVSPTASPVLRDAVLYDRVGKKRILPTVCHAVAGNIDAGSITIELCRELVSGWPQVDECAIYEAGTGVRSVDGLCLDGSAAAAVAGVRQMRTEEPSDRLPVVIICGVDRGESEW